MGIGLSVSTVHPFNNEKGSDKSSFSSPPPKKGGEKRGNLGGVGAVRKQASIRLYFQNLTTLSNHQTLNIGNHKTPRIT